MANKHSGFDLVDATEVIDLNGGTLQLSGGLIDLSSGGKVEGVVNQPLISDKGGGAGGKTLVMVPNVGNILGSAETLKIECGIKIDNVVGPVDIAVNYGLSAEDAADGTLVWSTQWAGGASGSIHLSMLLTDVATSSRWIISAIKDDGTSVDVLQNLSVESYNLTNPSSDNIEVQFLSSSASDSADVYGAMYAVVRD